MTITTNVFSLTYTNEISALFFGVFTSFSSSISDFRDIRPQAPVHVLIIPKNDIPKVSDVKGKEHAQLLGEMFDAANKIARDLGISDDGFRLVFNCGPNG
ncbi:MAG: HIT domain-containing protein, partial [Planktothrix agardhii]|uniref:HIT domain-containing protein n=1 Tax=Planktothrix agardhii TaxID=1160 RepID=UPI003C51B3F6